MILVQIYRNYFSMTTKERLISFLKYLNISQGVFEKKVGLSTGFVNNVGDSIRTKSLAKITSVYPQLNTSWLLTGVGNPLLIAQEDPERQKKEIHIFPSDIKYGECNGTLVYDIDGTCGADSREIQFTTDSVVGCVNLPEIKIDSRIITANGDSMEPVVFSGDRVVIREIFDWNDIFYGQIYFILLDEYRMIKYIRRFEADEENYIILRSRNKEYDDIKLSKDKIRKLFVVENILSVKTQM